MNTCKYKLQLACAVGAAIIASTVGVTTGQAAFQARLRFVAASLPVISVARVLQGGEASPIVGIAWRMHPRSVRETPYSTTPLPYVMQDPWTPAAERPLPDPHADSNGG